MPDTTKRAIEVVVTRPGPLMTETHRETLIKHQTIVPVLLADHGPGGVALDAVITRGLLGYRQLFRPGDQLHVRWVDE